MRLDYRKTFLIGFGFFASSLAWSLYNSFVPLMLENYLASTAIIGTIMTIDNFFGVVFQPLIGQVSDRTHTRFGKRMPYIMIGIPVCAVLFALIPLTNTLALMMGFIIAFNLVMSVWRSPVVALMPDMTPAPLRSKANGVINLMGGVGSIIAFVLGQRLYNLAGFSLPFLAGSIVMVLALIMLLIFVKEPDTRKMTRRLEFGEAALAENADQTADKTDTVEERGIRHLSGPEKRSLISLLFAIFFWFCGFNAVEAFFTLYVKNVFNIVDTLSLAIFSVAFVAFALPSGILAGHIGRKRMIVIGLIGIIAVFTPMLFLQDLLVMRILLFVGGIFWACININSLPMVVELASPERLGSFTGYYYFFSFSAAIASPILFGILRDLTQNYSTLFIYSIVAFFLALIALIFVKHGEAKPVTSNG